MNLLFIGDIVGKPGRELVRVGLGGLVARHDVDLVIANGENAAAGFGLTGDICRALFDYGVDVLTSGNHIWDKKEVLDYIGGEPRLIRPANYPPGTPGRGATVAETRDGRRVGVLNLMGRVFMPSTDNPFAVAEKEIEALRRQTKVIFVDMHGETTSEKMAMGWHLDGRVSAVVGTHTHVQTADERVLPKGTAYLSDAGMTGPHDSIIGMQIEPSLARFRTAMPSRFEPATGNPRLNGALVSVDADTGRATAITRVSHSREELEALAADAAPAQAPAR